MIQACNDVGFAINPNKLGGPSTVLEYLGFTIDTEKMEIRISPDRLDIITAALCMWQLRKSCRKRELLSLIGELIFVSKVVRSGRTFIRRLIERSKRAKHNNQYIKLDQSLQADIKWWLHYLPK